MSHTFPIDRLNPKPAVVRGTPGDYTIEIPLAPFEIDDLEVETSIYLDHVSLPSLDWKELKGRRFSFPVNPEQGYIDGSIYIEHAHHPVDVTAITFDDAEEDTLRARFAMRFLFEYEGLGDYGDTDAELSVELLRA